jgi:hypothetical protein
MMERLNRAWKQLDQAYTEHERRLDGVLNAGAAIAIVLIWIRDRRTSARLADVKVPNATPLIVWLISRIKFGQIKGPMAELGKNMEAFGTMRGNRMRQNDERAARELALQQSIEQLTREGELRSKQELALQLSVERLTRRLVLLTYVLGIIGIAGIGATILAAVR